MQRVYSSPERSMVYHLKNILENHGIESTVLGEYRGGVVGGVAPLDAWMELWVLDEQRLEAAQQIVETTLKYVQTAQETWRCQNCGEELEGQFAQCWKCGADRM
jgi:anaerobic ribonucleoside-triphosphate reductase